MSEVIKIATVNCQGLGCHKKRRDVPNYYKNKNYSIICLQDTHFTSELEPYIESQWGYTCVFNSFRSNARGVAIMFNNNFEFKLHRQKKDQNGNLLALDITINSSKFTLINLYGPNSDVPEFFEYVSNIVTEFDNLYTIICGDFNVSLNYEMDTFNYVQINNPRARDKLLQIMSDLDLKDYFRILNPELKLYTWHKRNPVKRARLDYFLTSENLTNLIENIYVKASYRSDHASTILEIKLDNFERGPGTWKFNNNLLNDKTFVEKVKSIILNVKKQYANILYTAEKIHEIPEDSICFDIHDSLFLEILLMEIRGVAISHASFKKKQRNILEKKLIKEIDNLEINTTNNTINFELLYEKKQALENIRKEKLQGHFIRARALWVEEGERPSHYFCHLESRNFTNKTIHKLETDNNMCLQNQSDILKECKCFYEKLYSDKEEYIEDIDLNARLDSYDIPKLNENEALELEQPISETEIQFVLKNMKNGKSPGSSGFTTEFYKFFWPDLKIFIKRSINDIFIKKNSSNYPTTRYNNMHTKKG